MRSGSDKSFDFRGIAKAIDRLKTIIIEIWNRVVYYRERKIQMLQDAVVNSLSIIELIGALEQDKKLGAEEAQQLRQRAVDGAKRFLECGAIIPDIQEHASFNPRN